MKRKSSKAKPKRKSRPRRAGDTKRRPADAGTVIVSRGASQLLPVGDGYELRMYADPGDAIAQGLDRNLAGRLFRRVGNCTGNCEKHESANGKTVWCVDINCMGTGSCACHLIEITKNPSGDYDETDLGSGYDRTSPYKKVAGCFYVCRCQT